MLFLATTSKEFRTAKRGLGWGVSALDYAGSTMASKQQPAIVLNPEAEAASA